MRRTPALFAVLLCAALACTQSPTTPQSREGDFVLHDFRFRSGETLPELRLHYATLGQSQLLTDWSGFAAFNFSSSSDGRHMAFLRGGEHIAMYMAELSQDGTRTLNSQSFNADENVNIPLAWSPDSKEVIFSSKRADRRLIYKLNIDQKTPVQLLTNSPGMNFYLARTTPDGAAIIFEGLPTGKEPIFSLYRAQLDGADPRFLFNSRSFVNYWCTGAKANFCVVGDLSPATNELVITRFDPNSGEKHEALRIALDPVQAHALMGIMPGNLLGTV
jgi:hypothetical protein